MKFIPSLSMSSASSSSPISFNDQFYTTQSCLTGVLRRIFCSGSFPTYPSDQLKETNPVDPHKLQGDELNGSGTPNIVARLMGLDSMPEINLGKTQKNPGSVTRSKSMNSVDWRLEGEKFEEQHKQQHRRVKTEIPIFLEIEDESFYVLSFENGGEESKEFWSRGGKFEMGFKEKKQRRRRQRMKQRRRTESVKVDTESDSENSSPVSVLDHSEFISDPEVTTTSEIVDEYPSDYSNGCSSGQNCSLEPNVESQKMECWRPNYQTDISRKVKRLAATEVLNLDWMYIGKKERGGDWGIGAELGGLIFDQLIDDVIDQMVGL